MLKKQPPVVDFIKKNKIDVIGLLETKMDQSSMDSFLLSYFPDWHHANNLAVINGRRIFLIWNPQTAAVNVASIEDRVIHTRIRCLRTLNEFNFSIVYGLYTNGD